MDYHYFAAILFAIVEVEPEQFPIACIKLLIHKTIIKIPPTEYYSVHAHVHTAEIIIMYVMY